MKQFSDLINLLETSNKTNDKIKALVNFFTHSSDSDKLWLIALFTGKRPKRPINSSLMRQWAMELSAIPEWLFLESYSNVGDLGETIALVLPPAQYAVEKDLSQWMDEINALHHLDDEAKKAYVINAWNHLDIQQRFIFNKLIGGSFRMGVSDKLLVNALAKYSGKEESSIMYSIMGKWQVGETTFNKLIEHTTAEADNSKPYPFCLAYALEKTLEELGNPHEWQVEYKWDGIRGQVIKRNGEIHIWSRGEELVTPQFPEITTAFAHINSDFVIDGEILVLKGGKVMNFNELQKRLNRKVLSKKLLMEQPVGFYVYDLLEINGKDMRNLSMSERRQNLEGLITESETIKISPIIHFSHFYELDNIRSGARQINSEGLMLKRKSSVYHSGRKKGDWWKWKISPLTIDAVLIYAQKGSGRRSGHYTDYTFAIRNGNELVTIAKAYSGLTDKEIAEVSRFVTKNSLEKFGPVRTVKPELVFEIAFEGIGYSNRHKSGVALRFPRIMRWRKDKTVADIDTIDTVKQLIVR